MKQIISQPQYRIYLRALEVNDYKTSYKWRQDTAIINYVGSTKRFISEHDEKKWITDYLQNKTDKNVRLAICLKENRAHIGNIYLLNIDFINRNSEYSILIGEKKYWGKGYGEESTRLILDYGFNELGLERIYLLVLEKHRNAINLYKKCGFKKEGKIRNGVYKNGSFQNQLLMSIVSSEYKINR